MKKKSYQIWYDADWPQSRLEQILGDGGLPTPFPEGFLHMGNVAATSLADAKEQAADQGSVVPEWGLGPSKPWQKNPGVEVLLVAMRDTDLGDVIVAPTGRAYRIAAKGFAEVLSRTPPDKGSDRETQETVREIGDSMTPSRSQGRGGRR